MALIGMECFDLYDTGDITDFFQGDALSSIVQGAGRCNTAALLNTAVGGNGPFIGVNTVSAGGYFGLAFKPTTLSVSGGQFEIANDTLSDIMLFLRFPATGSIQVWKGPNTVLGTLVGETAPNLMSDGQYTHVGLEFKFDAAVGYAKIYANGVLAFDSGLTNIPASFGQWNLLSLRPRGYIDDVYWGDLSGPSPGNAFLGDLTIEGQVALTDAVGGGGFYQQWTPSSGTDHGALVDEIPPDDGTTCVESATIGHKELFKFPNIRPSSGAVYGIQLMPNAVKDVAGGRQITALVRSGGSDANGVRAWGVALTTYKYYWEMFELNPVGSVAWTVATANAMQGGIEITG